MKKTLLLMSLLLLLTACSGEATEVKEDTPQTFTNVTFENNTLKTDYLIFKVKEINKLAPGSVQEIDEPLVEILGEITNKDDQDEIPANIWNFISLVTQEVNSQVTPLRPVIHEEVQGYDTVIENTVTAVELGESKDVIFFYYLEDETLPVRIRFLDNSALLGEIHSN